MMILDYLIIAIVTVLFLLATVVYVKKPHCCCGKNSGCNGNCVECCIKCENKGE